MDNPEKHWEKTQNKDKQNKNTTQKTKQHKILMVRVCFHDGETISFRILLIQLYSIPITFLYNIVNI